LAYKRRIQISHFGPQIRYRRVDGHEFGSSLESISCNRRYNHEIAALLDPLVRWNVVQHAAFDTRLFKPNDRQRKWR
jgi:hypothetical protein